MKDETGKPISRAMGEINATLGRIDFFVHHVHRVMAPTVAYQEIISQDHRQTPGVKPIQPPVTVRKYP